MTSVLSLSPTVRGLTTLYTSALLAGMWSMVVPAVPVICLLYTSPSPRDS